MHNEYFHHVNEGLFYTILFLPFVFLLIFYIWAVSRSNRHYKRWPFYRTSFWFLGIFCIATVVVGPFANLANTNFTAHMFGHLLLGMLAPLLLVLSAPMTLILRTLNVKMARHLSSFLRSRLLRNLTGPFVTAFLNVGGLWILYTTQLYSAMHHNILLHLFIHIHVFIAGYLFTASIIYIDPTPHRKTFLYRAIVLVMALAGHGILAKYIYAHPPVSVPIAEAEMGGMLMYYGGDVVDIMLIFIFCLQWYKSSKSRERVNKSVSV